MGQCFDAAQDHPRCPCLAQDGRKVEFYQGKKVVKREHAKVSRARINSGPLVSWAQCGSTPGEECGAQGPEREPLTPDHTPSRGAPRPVAWSHFRGPGGGERVLAVVFPGT